jgi:hypothetical protein
MVWIQGLCWLGKCPTSRSTSPELFALVIFLLHMRFHIFHQTSLKLQSPNLLLLCIWHYRKVPPCLNCLLRWGFAKFWRRWSQIVSYWSLPPKLQGWPTAASLVTGFSFNCISSQDMPRFFHNIFYPVGFAIIYLFPTGISITFGKILIFLKNHFLFKKFAINLQVFLPLLNPYLIPLNAFQHKPYHDHSVTYF